MGARTMMPSHNHLHNHLSETGLDGPRLPVTISPRLHSFLRRRFGPSTSCQGGRRGFEPLLPLKKNGHLPRNRGVAVFGFWGLPTTFPPRRAVLEKLAVLGQRDDRS